MGNRFAVESRRIVSRPDPDALRKRRYLYSQLILPKGDGHRPMRILAPPPIDFHIKSRSSVERRIPVACKMGAWYKLGLFAYRYVELATVTPITVIDYV